MVLELVNTSQILKAFKFEGLQDLFKVHKVQMSFSTSGLLVYNNVKSVEVDITKADVKSYTHHENSVDPSSIFSKKHAQLKAAIETVVGGPEIVSAAFFPSTTDSKYGVGKCIPVDNPTDPPSEISKAWVMKQIPVALLKADTVYQPVSSTSAGSKYFVVALSKDIKIAARLKIGSVSIRAEGELLKHKSSLLDAGYGFKPDTLSPTHASLHVEAEGSLRYKVVGSALFGLGILFDKVIEDISLLSEKGA